MTPSPNLGLDGDWESDEEAEAVEARVSVVGRMVVVRAVVDEPRRCMRLGILK